MSAQNNGGPAFPQFGPQVVGLESDGAPKLEYEFSEGMTLRDYFAAKAMQGWLTGVDAPIAEKCAKFSYAMADAMLEARK